MLDDKALIRKLRREVESLKQQLHTLQPSSSSTSTLASSVLSSLMPIPAGVEAFISATSAPEGGRQDGISPETQKTLDTLNQTIKDQELTIWQLTSEKSTMQATLDIASVEKDGLQREKQSIEEELKQMREKLERMQERQDWEEQEKREKNTQMEVEEEKEEEKKKDELERELEREREFQEKQRREKE